MHQVGHHDLRGNSFQSGPATSKSQCKNECAGIRGAEKSISFLMPQPIVDWEPTRKCNLHALCTWMGVSKRPQMSHPIPPPQLTRQLPAGYGVGGVAAALPPPQPPDTAVHTLPMLVLVAPRGLLGVKGCRKYNPSSHNPSQTNWLLPQAE